MLYIGSPLTACLEGKLYVEGVEEVWTIFISMIGEGGRPSFFSPLPLRMVEAREDSMVPAPPSFLLSSMVSEGDGSESYITSSSVPRFFSFSRKLELLDKGFSFPVLESEASFLADSLALLSL